MNFTPIPAPFMGFPKATRYSGGHDFKIMGCVMFNRLKQIFLRGGVKPNIELLIDDGLWYIKNIHGYQSRNFATIHMLTEALKGISVVDLMKKKKISIWTEDLLNNERLSGINLAYCSQSEQESVLLIPDFIFWYWPEIGVPDYTSLTSAMVEAGKNRHLFDEVFWIGNPKVHPSRQKLIVLGQTIPNTKFIDISWVSHELPEHMPSDTAMTTKDGRFVSLPDHCNYRFLVDVEGRGYSGRLKILMFSNRPIFVQHRPWVEFYVKDLKPFVHYIPVSRSLEDLADMIEWAKCHESECLEIAANAQAFALEKLTRQAAITFLRKQILYVLNNHSN